MSKDNQDKAVNQENYEVENQHIPQVHEIEEDEDLPATTDQVELLRWHYRFGKVTLYKLHIFDFYCINYGN